MNPSAFYVVRVNGLESARFTNTMRNGIHGVHAVEHDGSIRYHEGQTAISLALESAQAALGRTAATGGEVTVTRDDDSVATHLGRLP